MSSEIRLNPHLLHRPRHARGCRRVDPVRPQTRGRREPRQLLVAPARPALLRARAACRRRLPDRAPRAEGQAAQALQDHRQGPQGAGRVAGGDDRRAPRAPRPGAAEGLLRRRPRGRWRRGSSPPTGRSSRSTNASSSSAASSCRKACGSPSRPGSTNEREWVRFWSRSGGVSYSESSTRSIVCGSSGRSAASVAVPSTASTASIPSSDGAEDGVLAVEPGRRVGGDDEELRAVGVRPGVGHRQRALDDLVVVELVLEGVAGAAGAGSLRAAALDHEVGDDPVEDRGRRRSRRRRACGSSRPSSGRPRRGARRRSARRWCGGSPATSHVGHPTDQPLTRNSTDRRRRLRSSRASAPPPGRRRGTGSAPSR